MDVLYLTYFVNDIYVSVATSDTINSCNQNSFVKLEQSTGYISSAVAHNSGMGSLRCPWRLEALPGQSISITVMDFDPVPNIHSCKPIG